MSWQEHKHFHRVTSRPAHSGGGFRWGIDNQIVWVPLTADAVPQGYLRRGMLDGAIAAYEVALGRNVDYMCPIVPRYHYRLAGPYEEMGMKKKAIEEYTKFLGIWRKTAPIYREPQDAKMRLAKLGGKP
jgi:tetratricopeptide (TPR) repeat protein